MIKEPAEIFLHDCCVSYFIANRQGTTKVPGQEENLSTGFRELDLKLDGGFLKTGVTEIQSTKKLCVIERHLRSMLPL